MTNHESLRVLLKLAALLACAVLLASLTGGFSWGGDEDGVQVVATGSPYGARANV